MDIGSTPPPYQWIDSTLPCTGTPSWYAYSGFVLSALLALLVVVAAVTTVTLCAAVVSDRRPGSWSSAVPVVGGFAPASHAWSRFHARWYPMALVFIAFEMEMMFMYPWAVVFVREGAAALIEMGVFLGILACGLLYGWREGVFRWQ